MAKNTVTVASAIAAAYKRLLPALREQAQAGEMVRTAAASRSSTCTTAITKLYSSLTRERFTEASIALFGNGASKKSERTIGSLATQLHADGVKAPEVYRTVSLCRTVCENMGSAAVREALKQGLRAAYDARPGGKVERDTTAKPTATATATKPTLEEMIGETIRAEGMAGAVRCLRMVESAMVVLKNPIKASVVREAAVKVAAS